MTLTKLKHIVVSEENYQDLRSLGKAGDSFNDVLTQILKQKKIPRGPQNQKGIKDHFREVET